jgi:hypothetical protein
MLDQELISRFAQLKRDMTDLDVIDLLGPPSTQRQGTLDANSGWGEQSAMWIRISPSDPYSLFVYLTNDRELAVWFALVNGIWKIALKLSVPKPLSVLS